MDYSELDSLFHPRSIAVVGASADYRGSLFIGIFLEHGFRGQIYPVNPRGREVLGLRTYASVRDIPGPVDYAFVHVPAEASVQVVKDCAAKGVRLAALFTAGFSESEIQGGGELERQVLKAARQGGVRLVGPNCLGIYCPAGRLSFAAEFPQQSGPVGALCQSGGNAIYLVRSGAARGMRFSKVISYGNAADINETDIIEYFAHDVETRVIIGYIEGVREGKRFSQALKEAALSKPVIVLKGGQSEVGAQASLSHTGSLSGSREVWDSLLRQAGAIQAYSIDECVDIALALLLIKPPRSRKAAVIGIGGGAAVQAADDCARAGLVLPSLPEETRRELKKFVPMAGNSFRNPVDITAGVYSPSDMGHAVKLVGSWTGVDLLILHLGIEMGPPRASVAVKTLRPLVEAMVNGAREVDKPAALVLHTVCSASGYQGFFEARQMCVEAGLPLYTSIQQAASAIDKLIRHHQSR